ERALNVRTFTTKVLHLLNHIRVLKQIVPYEVSRAGIRRRRPRWEARRAASSLRGRPHAPALLPCAPATPRSGAASLTQSRVRPASCRAVVQARSQRRTEPATGSAS